MKGEFGEVGGGAIGEQTAGYPSFPHPSAPPHPSSAHGEAPRLQGSPSSWGSRSLGSPGRFSGLLCFPFQPQLVPGFVISKGDKAPDGRKLAGAQGAGPSALGASQKIVPWKQGSCP